MGNYNRNVNHQRVAQYDKRGRDAIVDFLESKFGVQKWRENDESHTNGPPLEGYWDVEAVIRGKVQKLEVEYSPRRFSRGHDTCHVPHRKQKTSADWIVTICGHEVWLCNPEIVKDSPTKWVDTADGKELMFNVAWELGWYARKIDGQWTTLKMGQRPY